MRKFADSEEGANYDGLSDEFEYLLIQAAKHQN